MDAAARARSVTKFYEDVVALDGVDVDILPGRIHGLVGPNGAGKTTLLGLLLGLSAPDRGELEVLGAPVSRALGVPDGVAGFVDAPGLYPALTARANLSAFLRLRRGASTPGRDERRVVDAALDEVGLADVADDRVRGFSLGMRQRLGLASAMLCEPRLLVLDEPANGLDPAGKRQVHAVLSRLAASGTAIVLSSHRMDDLTALCSDVTVLTTGQVVFSGPLDELVREHGDAIDYRVLTPDPTAATQVARRLGRLEVRPQARDGAFVAHGRVADIDELVLRLAEEGIPVRELGPVVPPLEAAFLALTDAGVARPTASREAAVR